LKQVTSLLPSTAAAHSIGRTAANIPKLAPNTSGSIRSPARPSGECSSRRSVGLEAKLVRNHRENELRLENPSASEISPKDAVMFYYGYLAARAGIHVIDVSKIDNNVHQVMDQCAAATNMTVAQAFRKALGRHR
jgi:hypothetical protein